MTTEPQPAGTTPAAPAPRRPRRHLVAFAAVAAGGIALGAAGATLLAGRGDGHDHGATEAAAPRYQCPMHPTVVQDHPGDCPICGMKLVAMAAAPAATPAALQGAAARPAAEKKPQYLCPMHPSVVSDNPKDRCPLCGMKLIPAPAAGTDAAGAGGGTAGTILYQCPMHPKEHQDHPGDCAVCGMKLEKLNESGVFDIPPGERKLVFYRSPMDPTQTSHTPRKDEMGMDYLPVYLDELQGSGPVEGLVTVKIDPARQQLIGLATAAVTRGTVSATLRTTGRVAVDETRVHRVNVKYAGFVERVTADFVGQAVRRGQPLFSIYSPELLAAQEEYLLALRTRQRLAEAGGMGGAGGDLVASARRKLELWDVPPATIARLEQTGQAERAVTVFSPVGGVVVKKEVVPGMRLEAGAMPYELWDLASVWVLADVYESELQQVRVGSPATLTLRAIPGTTYQGKVAFIDPVLDPKTRTAKVRIAFANPGGTLKPEMFGEVVLSSPPRQALRIPADAVIDSGTRSVVFVVLGDGKFQPRVVRLGASDGDQVELLDGLAVGDQIVTRANFLVDSESRLKASLQALGGGNQAMIKAIIRFSAENKYLVVAATLVALAGAWWSMKNIPLDALPDMSDTQVIIYSKWDRSPDIIEDQVTYPITAALLGAPRVKAIRGFSDFGFSYVYVIFEDGTDLYWARTRVLEYLSKIQPQLPGGVKTELGPDASSVGWVFQYALVDRSGTHSSDELRSFQDWNLRYAVQSVPGVSEVATVGGQVRQYQITVNPNALASYKLPLDSVITAVRRGNNDVGGRLVELSGREYMVRGRGYVKSISDLEKLVLKAEGGTPVTVKDVATVALGPEMRRGIADSDGQGDVVGGIVVMRSGENALNVIERVKTRLEELKPSLPAGVEVVTTYDRSVLINQAIETVKWKLIEEMIVVSIIILIFLWHIPSAIIPIVTIPVSVALAFIPMYFMGLNANLMSMAGIAISIGVLVDGAIVEVENAYNKIHHWDAGGRKEDFHQVRLEALLEVGPGVFFSLLVIAVAFMPVFTLVDQEGRLFRPLAYSKNLAMAIAAFLAITLDPAMRMMFARIDPFSFRPRWLARVADGLLVGKYHSEERHPISAFLHRIYEPPCRLVLRHPRTTIALAFALVATTVPVYLKLGSEFMPPLNEGTILYMPSAVQPGMSVAEAQKALQVQDKILMTFPEVERVFGKAGRADTSTDPAPFTMMETTIILKPEHEWRETPRWYSAWAPAWAKAVLRPFWRDRITEDDLKNEMDAALQLPGISNAWTMPIRGRLDMLSTGIRTPVGIKVSGANLEVIEKTAKELEAVIQKVPGTRSVYAERVAGGYFLDFVLKRDQLARYGLSVDDANTMVMTAVGGDVQTVTVMGRERYGVSVRYARDYREDIQALRRVLLPLPGGQGQIPMEEIAAVELVQGPSMIRDENGALAGYVYVDFDTSKIDVGSYVEEAKKAVASGVTLPTGYNLAWSGQYENMLRVKERLKFILPLTLVLIFALLYMNTKSAVKASIVMLAVPFSAIGAVWLIWALDYNVSIAIWVGMIALMGLDAETGVFMLLFLDLSHDEARKAGRLRDEQELVEAIIHGAVKRVRPKAMTVFAAMIGLLPIMWSTGTGADLMKRIAAPMVGGLATSFLLELLVYPAVYFLWRRRELPPASPATRPAPALAS